MIFIVLLFALTAYFFPFLYAAHNHKRDAFAIGMLNFWLGWTFLGWVIALVWACRVDRA